MSYCPEYCPGYIPDKKGNLFHFSRSGNKGDKGAGCTEESAPEDTFSAIGREKILALSHIFWLNDVFLFNKFTAEASEEITGIITNDRS